MQRQGLERSLSTRLKVVCQPKGISNIAARNQRILPLYPTPKAKKPDLLSVHIINKHLEDRAEGGAGIDEQPECSGFEAPHVRIVLDKPEAKHLGIEGAGIVRTIRLNEDVSRRLRHDFLPAEGANLHPHRANTNGL